MAKNKIAILLLWAFFASCMRLELRVEAVTHSSLLEKEIEAKLKLLNKPAVKTIKSEDGDIIDCVNIYEQPAFDHPALKNHTIQRIPDFFLQSQNSSTKDAIDESNAIFQIWQKSGSCPKGTIPIRRIRKEDLLRASSLDRFGRKPSEFFITNSTNTTNLNFSTLISPNGQVVLPNRSDAHLVATGYNFIGAQGDINVWNPKVELPDDFTTAQIWLKAGNGNDFESVEAGWMVNPKLYGDHGTRFFVHWTKDSYKSTGCFDLTCHGFVQTNPAVTLGSSLAHISTPHGPQYDLKLGIFWDNSGNWWVKVNGNVPVGYFPGELLTGLKHSATIVQWGGQVYSSEVRTSPDSPHTGTAMGSGFPAADKEGAACYVKNVRIKDYSQALKYPQFVSTWALEPYCYSALNYAPLGQEPVFYFGGPGRKPPYCP